MPHFLDTISPQVHRVGSGRFRQWTGPRRIIYDHELLLISEGECRTDVEGERVVSKAPAFIIKPPGRPHSAVQISREPVHFHWIHFDWNYHESIRTSSSQLICYLPGRPNLNLVREAPPEVPTELLHGPLRSPATAQQLFIRIQERWNFGTPRERSSCRALLLELLIEVLGEQQQYFPASRQHTQKNHTAEKIRSMLNRIVEDVSADKLSLESRLSSLGYSYPHLCRIFKAAYGISPVTYLNNARMERACMLLKDTEMLVADIAGQVGIPNPAYFARLFTKYTGTSPRQFRSDQ